MRSPDLALAGNLRWTRHGTCWADFILQPLPYAMRQPKDKAAVRALHRSLIRALPGESLLLGVAVEADPASVIARMIDGVDLGSAPAWAQECAARLDDLDRMAIGRRVFWLSVPLGHRSTADRLREPFRAAMADLRDQLGLPRAPIPPAEVERRRAHSDRVLSTLPAEFGARPATPAQMVWLSLHSQQRGLRLDPDLPEGSYRDLLPPGARPRSGSALPDALIDEGGRSDLESKARWNPAARRWLKVSQPSLPETVPASYQVPMVVADVPDAFAFPGGELLGHLDDTGIDIDWAIRLQVRSSAEVAKANQRALANLHEQYLQRDNDLGGSGMSRLDRAARDLQTYSDVLDSDRFEVEAQATIVLAVAAPDPQAAGEQARAVSGWVREEGYRLVTPLGGLADLWRAMQPGHPAGRVVREFAQITTSHDLAALVPLASSGLGDDRGPLLGLNISTGRAGVVLHDPAGAAAKDTSGSLAVAGELGSGKSVVLKTLTAAMVDRGGQAIVVDRTKLGEYARWAGQIAEAVVVDIADPSWSLDPLRVLGGRLGSRVTQSFLTPLLNVAPMSPAGTLLSEVLDPAHLEAAKIRGLGGLLDHLRSRSEPEAGELARTLAVIARSDYGRVLFDDDLPPMPMTAPATVIRTHTLQLPDGSELATPHLFHQLPVEKVFGRAAYALIGALARQVCFADPSRTGVFTLDEVHHLTATREGQKEVTDFVRDGRKHGALILLGSHDPERDFGDDTLRGLIPTRLLLRQRDKDLARKSLDWLDLDSEDEALVTLVTEGLSPVVGDGVPVTRRGEGIMRDGNGSIGLIKALLPALPARAEAALTTPPAPPRREVADR